MDDIMEIKFFCCVDTCKHVMHSNAPRTFFGFPLGNEELLKSWINVLGLGETFVPDEYSVICCNHFTVNDYVKKNGIYDISEIAIPTRRHRSDYETDNDVESINNTEVCPIYTVKEEHDTDDQNTNTIVIEDEEPNLIESNVSSINQNKQSFDKNSDNIIADNNSTCNSINVPSILPSNSISKCENILKPNLDECFDYETDNDVESINNTDVCPIYTVKEEHDTDEQNTNTIVIEDEEPNLIESNVSSINQNEQSFDKNSDNIIADNNSTCNSINVPSILPSNSISKCENILKPNLDECFDYESDNDVEFINNTDDQNTNIIVIEDEEPNLIESNVSSINQNEQSFDKNSDNIIPDNYSTYNSINVPSILPSNSISKCENILKPNLDECFDYESDNDVEFINNTDDQNTNIIVIEDEEPNLIESNVSSINQNEQSFDKNSDNIIPDNYSTFNSINVPSILPSNSISKCENILKPNLDECFDYESDNDVEFINNTDDQNTNIIVIEDEEPNLIESNVSSINQNEQSFDKNSDNIIPDNYSTCNSINVPSILPSNSISKCENILKPNLDECFAIPVDLMTTDQIKSTLAKLVEKVLIIEQEKARLVDKVNNLKAAYIDRVEYHTNFELLRNMVAETENELLKAGVDTSNYSLFNLARVKEEVISKKEFEQLCKSVFRESSDDNTASQFDDNEIK